jgi:hypothetical protein
LLTGSNLFLICSHGVWTMPDAAKWLHPHGCMLLEGLDIKDAAFINHFRG